jgi:hypothetical protein
MEQAAFALAGSVILHARTEHPADDFIATKEMPLFSFLLVF